MCVCACVSACVRACVRGGGGVSGCGGVCGGGGWVCVCVRARVRACLRACERACVRVLFVFPFFVMCVELFKIYCLFFLPHLEMIMGLLSKASRLTLLHLQLLV